MELLLKIVASTLHLIVPFRGFVHESSTRGLHVPLLHAAPPVRTSFLLLVTYIFMVNEVIKMVDEIYVKRWLTTYILSLIYI